MITVSGIETLSTHLSGNDILITLSTDSYPLYGMDYKLLLKIVSTDGHLDGSPFIPAITPKEGGSATFNISGYVDQRNERKITWPVKQRYEGKLMGWGFGSYTIWLYPGESWIDTVDGKLKESFQEPFQPVFIVKGRLPEIKLAELNDMGLSWYQYYCEGGRFLSYMPTVQYVSPYQPTKLWWIPPGYLTSVNIFLKYYIGNSSETITLFSGELYGNYLWEIECHPGEAGAPLTDQAGNLLEKYEVWIENAGTPVTEIRTFIIDWTPPHKDYYYLFADNRMGGIETITLSGRKLYKPSGARVQSKRPFPKGSGVQVPTRIPVSANRQRKWTINTGWKSKEELAALDFLLDSEHAWLALPPESGSVNIFDYKLCPVIISNTEFILNDDTKEIESVDIDLEEAY